MMPISPPEMTRVAWINAVPNLAVRREGATFPTGDLRHHCTVRSKQVYQIYADIFNIIIQLCIYIYYIQFLCCAGPSGWQSICIRMYIYMHIVTYNYMYLYMSTHTFTSIYMVYIYMYIYSYHCMLHSGQLVRAYIWHHAPWLVFDPTRAAHHPTWGHQL